VRSFGPFDSGLELVSGLRVKDICEIADIVLFLQNQLNSKYSKL
jgi:hypothetical protein